MTAADWRLIAYAGGDEHGQATDESLTVETCQGELWIKAPAAMYRFPLNEVMDALTGRTPPEYEVRGAVDFVLPTYPERRSRPWWRRT